MFISVLVIVGIVIVLYSACVASGRCAREEERIELIKEKNE